MHVRTCTQSTPPIVRDTNFTTIPTSIQRVHSNYGGGLKPSSGDVHRATAIGSLWSQGVRMWLGMLCADLAPWDELATMFDESWFVDVPVDTAMDRLLHRQVQHTPPPLPPPHTQHTCLDHISPLPAVRPACHCNSGWHRSYYANLRQPHESC